MRHSAGRWQRCGRLAACIGPLDRSPNLLYTDPMQITQQFRDTIGSAFADLFGSEPANSNQRWDYYSDAEVAVSSLLEQVRWQKDEALRSLYRYLGSYSQVAEATGLSRSRVQQIVERSRLA